ncbi:copper resistance protein B [Luteimonas huabeiensis]|uniref:copper resistance protein B n=1 Tax=Luteimonas huabeiensis TaxID=1244513 RepID=UPI0004B5FBA3|nr:copper resistance protein B [Luteimonas huabeiensis]
MRTRPFLPFLASPAPLALAVLLALPQLAPAQHEGHAGHARHDAPTPAPASGAQDPHAGHAHGAHGARAQSGPDVPARDDAAPASAHDQAGHGAHEGHADHAGHDAPTPVPASGTQGPHAGHAHDAHGARAQSGHAGQAEPAPQTGHAGHAGHDAHATQPGAHDAHAAHGTAPTQPRTPIPPLTAADIASGFPVLDHGAMEHASPTTTMVRFDRLEAWDADHGAGQAWEAAAWIGGDLHRLWLRSEGERSGGRTASSDLEALYGRSVSPWWDVVAGVRHDVRPDARTWAAFGVQGLAPYLFEVSATAYVGDGGQVQAKAEAEYDVRFTNRLILQPWVEATASLKDEPEAGIGSGLGKIEAGLRLRYEISRRFAPYVGLVHERAFGASADLAEAAGGHARDTRVVAGVRLWF